MMREGPSLPTITFFGLPLHSDWPIGQLKIPMLLFPTFSLPFPSYFAECLKLLMVSFFMLNFP